MENLEPDDARYDRFADAIGKAMAYVANEATLFARLEEFFEPKPAVLADDEHREAIETRISGIIVRLGGPPKLIVRHIDKPPRTYDTYPIAAFEEAISSFHLARRSVCRAHTFMLGSTLLRSHPEWIQLPQDEKARNAFQSNGERAFWEHAETAFINLCCYWDRLGQLLDFAYFGIRQFERDGFPAVMDRIHANAVPMRSELRDSSGWTALRHFQTSEKDNGLKWLLRRRNLCIHSLHLRPITSAPDEKLFASAYNHLEDKLASRLAPRSLVEEVNQLHVHLSKAARMFPNMLSVLELSEDQS